MKNSKVTVSGLTKIQANALAVMFDNGDMAQYINAELERLGLQEDKIKQRIPAVDFIDYDDVAQHQVLF